MDKESKQYAGPFTYVAAALVLGLFIIFLILMYCINSEVEFSWEKPIQVYFQNWNMGIGNSFFTYWTELGSYNGVLVSAACLVAWLWWKHRDYSALVVVPMTVFLTNKINVFVKGLVGRERPMINPAIDATGYSFPSGHAMLSVVTYGFAIYLLSKYAKNTKETFFIWVAGIALIITIGISRVVLSAHFPSDVFAGYCLGVVILVLSVKLYKILSSWIKKKRSPKTRTKS